MIEKNFLLQEKLKRIVLISGILVTMAYEIYLFGKLLAGGYGLIGSLFFTYIFSLIGALPLALLLSFGTKGEAHRWGETDSKEVIGFNYTVPRKE